MGLFRGQTECKKNRFGTPKANIKYVGFEILNSIINYKIMINVLCNISYLVCIVMKLRFFSFPSLFLGCKYMTVEFPCQDKETLQLLFKNYAPKNFCSFKNT